MLSLGTLNDIKEQPWGKATRPKKQTASGKEGCALSCSPFAGLLFGTQYHYSEDVAMKLVSNNAAWSPLTIKGWTRWGIGRADVLPRSFDEERVNSQLTLVNPENFLRTSLSGLGISGRINLSPGLIGK